MNSVDISRDGLTVFWGGNSKRHFDTKAKASAFADFMWDFLNGYC